MILPGCDDVRDILPDAVGGRLEPARAAAVAAHLAVCDECRAEMELLRVFAENRVAVPAGLEARVRAAAARPRRSFAAPALLAASVAAALLGGAAMLRQPRSPQESAEASVSSTPVDGRSLLAPLPGAADDGLATGDASLDDLSVEELQSLLKELNS